MQTHRSNGWDSHDYLWNRVLSDYGWVLDHSHWRSKVCCWDRFGDSIRAICTFPWKLLSTGLVLTLAGWGPGKDHDSCWPQSFDGGLWWLLYPRRGRTNYHSLELWREPTETTLLRCPLQHNRRHRFVAAIQNWTENFATIFFYKLSSFFRTIFAHNFHGRVVPQQPQDRVVLQITLIDWPGRRWNTANQGNFLLRSYFLWRLHLRSRNIRGQANQRDCPDRSRRQ